MKRFTTDILIVGGGSAGLAAAIAASKNGSKVVLIEKNAYLGGKATAAEVGTICGLYAFSTENAAELAVKGFAREFAEQLKRLSETEAITNSSGLFFLPYAIEKYKELSWGLLYENGVHVLLDTVLKDIKVKDQFINEALLLSNDEHVHLSFKAIVDCTGNSLVSQLANQPLIPSDHFQAAAQVFTLSGLKESNESVLTMVLLREIAKAIHEGKLDASFDRLYLVPGSLKNESVSLKIAIPLEVKKDNHEQLRQKALSMIDDLITYLNANSTVFKRAKVEHIADEVGTRTDLRPVGKYILSEQDVIGCEKFENAIANGFWPIEEWGQHRSVRMHYLAENDHYQIPADCLMSLEISNLYFAGRGISADDKAIASARVMGTCLQTGYAAGRIASAQTFETPLNSIVKAIQEEQIFP
jgi:threonine dehydrogenase-like Zn-dependent dehydrogenase